MKKTLISMVSLALLLGGCSKDECESTTDSRLYPVSFLPFMDGFKETRAMKTAWVDGDAIAIFSDYAVNGNGNTSTASITYTRGSSQWASPSEEERWYLSNAMTEYNFYAYYPTGTATSYASVEIPDISGQDGTKTINELKEENDFLRGATTVRKDSPVANLQMFRVFAIINFNIKLKQDAFLDNEVTLTDIILTSTGSLPLVNPDASTKATVNLSDGEVTCAGGLTTLTLSPLAGFGLTTSNISVPIKIYPHDNTIQVQFTIGGKTSPVLTLSTTNFVGGRVYNYQIEINSDITSSQVGDPFIFDWWSVNGDPLTPVIPD